MSGVPLRYDVIAAGVATVMVSSSSFSRLSPRELLMGDTSGMTINTFTDRRVAFLCLLQFTEMCRNLQRVRLLRDQERLTGKRVNDHGVADSSVYNSC